MVPNGWSKHKFYEIVRDTQLGTTERHKGDICNNQIPLLKMGNLTWGGFNLNTVEQLPREKFDSTLLLKKGDFLFNTRNTPELVGKSAVWNDELPEAIFDNNINRISFKNGIDPFYMVAYLNNGRGKAIINSLPAGSTSVAAIYWKDLKNIHVTIPPLPEQQKIAKILSTWDKAIATTERLIATSQQQKKALMQQLLTGKKRLVNPDTGMVFEGDWEEVKLGDITQFIKDGTHGTHQRYESGVPMLSATNITKAHTIDFSDAPYISEEDYKKIHAKYTIENGDILLTVVGTLGRVAIVHTDCKFTLQRSVAILRVNDAISNQFLKQVISSTSFGHVLQSKSNSTAQAGIYLGELSKIKLNLPTYVEQQKIASVLTAADKEIELLQTKLAHLKDEKKALMQQLLTGKRRVKVDTTEAA
ncbi:restriction endonuclease subunit S [Vibrio fluvialis]|nr:restriction endonuclease subunit S [Vibrio fluvialis]